MEVGDKLNPQRSYRKGFALKGLQEQHIIKTNNPSAIGPNELLPVRFPDLKVQMKCFFLFPNLKEQQKSGRLPFTVS